jgi:hypothetical protein
MRAREFCTNNINESLNQPFKLVGGDDDGYSDEITTWAKLPDGTDLDIRFKQENKNYNDWDVDFRRGDSMLKTGQGLAQQIFATVLEAIRQFIKKVRPDKISFSALKDQDETGSRQSLYVAFAKKYAAGMGYSFEISDNGPKQDYVFKKIRQGVAEGRLIK